MRYIFGPAFGPYAIDTPPPPPPPDKSDVIPLLLMATPEAGVVLSVPAFNPETEQAPAEYRAYFLPEGTPPPATAAEYLASPFAVVTSATVIESAGGTVTLTPPALPAGVYVGQVILGYTV